MKAGPGCRWGGLTVGLFGVSLLLGPPLARGVVFHATGDPDHNTTAPGGALANSGWQWQGFWRGFAGTPVAPQWFLTARHLNGTVGEEFSYAGRTYRTTATFSDPETDLALWRVCGTFPAYAPLYADSDELGRECVLHGTGLARGGELTVTNPAGTALLRGWYWAPNTQRLRWGVNRVAGITAYGTTPDAALYVDFDANGGEDEATLTGGDSGGGLFIQSGGVWKLAGVGLAVEGPFRLDPAGEDIWAAVFDSGGLYQSEGEGWVLAPLRPKAQPAAAFVTRISGRRAWIEATIAANPEPVGVPTVLAAPEVAGSYVAVPATGDAASQTLRVPVPALPTFYRLSGCVESRVVAIRVEADLLVLQYALTGFPPE